MKKGAILGINTVCHKGCISNVYRIFFNYFLHSLSNTLLFHYFSILKIHFAKWNLKKENFKGVEIYILQKHGGKKLLALCCCFLDDSFCCCFCKFQEKKFKQKLWIFGITIILNTSTYILFHSSLSQKISICVNYGNEIDLPCVCYLFLPNFNLRWGFLVTDLNM